MSNQEFLNEIEKLNLDPEEFEWVCDYMLFLILRQKFGSMKRMLLLF